MNTCMEELYRMLHPREMSLENRKKCLFDLKKTGYQVGSGFMVGAPGQTPEHLLKDIRFLQQLQVAGVPVGEIVEEPGQELPSGRIFESHEHQDLANRLEAAFAPFFHLAF